MALVELDVLSQPFPFTTFTLQVGIAPISIHAAPTHRILLEVEDFRIWHTVENLSECADVSATRADKGADPFAAFSGHGERVGVRADKKYFGEEFTEI